MSDLKKLTNNELLNKRNVLFKKIANYEKEAHKINNGEYPGADIDDFMKEDYKDLISDEINLLLEIIKRDNFLIEL